MIFKIRKRIEKELPAFVEDLGEKYAIKEISPVLFGYIKDFVLRPGKRIRPTLLAISYLGFTGKPAPGLYTTAISLELLHDFMLVHDDIIDKSDLRRGSPSMHQMLNRYLARYKNLKFNGQDLAIVAGDVMYAAAIYAFLAIKEEWPRKEEALKKFIEAAIYTGSGEFIELLNGTKSIDDTSKEDIYRIYDFKTAYYTFATPLSAGAILAAASLQQTELLFQYGIYIGRAFQIKDDILGMFGYEKETGKSNLTDLKESKKTLLVWYAYHNSGRKNKRQIKNILTRRDTGKSELMKMRQILTSCGALEYSKKEIEHYLRKADTLNKSCRMKAPFKKALSTYSREILKL